MKLHAQYMLFSAGFSLFLAVFLSGCGSTEVHQVFLRQPSMIAHRDIEVYVTGAPPKRAYYDIAILQAIARGSDADVEHVTHAIANRAARLGCNAVVRLHIELGAARAHGTGVCVNWARAQVMPPLPAPSAAPATTTPEPTSPTPTPADDSGGTSI